VKFDNTTRNRLQRLVGTCRTLLTEEFDSQLQERFGIFANEGRIFPTEKIPYIDPEQARIASLLRERIEHLVATEGAPADRTNQVIWRVLREQAFTVLNRFAALRMSEERGIIQETVGGGLRSKGFQVFETVALSGTGSVYERYRVFIHRMFDEIAVDLGVLFDRFSPFGLLFPREQTLLRLFELLNDTEIKPLWREDETIGWIYQYYNDAAERKQMRELSSAPRNSRELAVRNQFFTPRYVVEFLTDNTLGRIWFEMTGGQTRLSEQCRFLARRPNEVFLGVNETAAEPVNSSDENLSREGLFKQPVYVPHRPLKDPRSIRMLDPACGSMHFGLYAFDLFEVIYDEAWELAQRSDYALNSSEAFAPFVAFVAQYPGKTAFLREVPGLIIEHNIHGIDIDPRCAQIAGLSLWLRAQRAWQEQRLQLTNRPRILRSNIVCAEPMPGEELFLTEFIEAQLSSTPEKHLLSQLVRRVFEAMKLAGEVGSLLRIEEEIASAVAAAKQKWLVGPQLEQEHLFDDDSAPPPQKELGLAATRIADDTFWQRAEERIYAALQAYAEQADQGIQYQRRIFADDAARGFAFIDLCRKRYDVVVMNPPFGTSSESAKEYIFSHFEREKIELGACFVRAHLARLSSGGQLGVIANRTILISRTFEDWRRRALRGLLQCADLGHGVLDALVETAAFTVAVGRSTSCSFYKLLDVSDKSEELQNCIEACRLPEKSKRTFDRDLDSFDSIDGFVFAYWLPASLLRKYTTAPKASDRKIIARSGLQTCDNFRFIRLVWEVPPSSHEMLKSWPRLTKGGDYQPFWSDIPLVVHWKDDGNQIKALVDSLYRQWSKQIPSVNLYRKPGATYTERTTSAISLRLLPENCLFDKKGPFVGFIGPEFNGALILQFIALSFTTPIKALIESSVGLRDATASGSPARDYLPSLLERLSFPRFSEKDAEKIQKASLICVLRHRDIACDCEASSVWRPSIAWSAHTSIAALVHSRVQSFRSYLREIYSAFAEIEHRALSVFEVSSGETESLNEILGDSIFTFETTEFEVEPEALAQLMNLNVDHLVDVVAKSHGMKTATLKQAFVGDRTIELLSFHFRRHPLQIVDKLDNYNIVPQENMLQTAQNVVSIAVGAAFGRWDIRYLTGEKSVPALPNPFAPLPICPPGQLQNEKGLPLTIDDVRRLEAVGQWYYPLDLPRDGILLDDPGHPADLEKRVHQVLQVIWKQHWETIEREACEILGVFALRDYFRNTTGFSADHLKLYSKSRRQAPIYWPLSTKSGSYTLWLYYSRLSNQTLYIAVNEFVKPKITQVEADLARASGADMVRSANRAAFEALNEFRSELIEFQDELLRVAQLPYKPNLNDGVLITAAPLWKLFRLPKWSKDLKACWDALSVGKYDWAHLAYSIWPERVKKVCETDRSIAIAHGLERLCTRPVGKSEKRRKNILPKEKSGED
jgi:hypothetical protein